jgi:2-methylcitrate dehydratase PrpD
MDAHDGQRDTKGHAGVAVLPALLAVADAGRRRPDEAALLTALVVGYEIGVRAGIAAHALAADYHSSGSWNALAAAAVAARQLGLDGAATRHALGVAEYHAPQGFMMRCIDHPAMVKDGSGWGAMTGVAAAYLAADGFSAPPPADVEAPAVGELWADLGRRWRTLEQYFKPYPVCRWTQPPVDAALALQRQHDVPVSAIEAIEVTTFHEATRLAVRRPRTTEEAQYSLPWPVAAALVRGRLGTAEVSEPFDDPDILRLADAVEMGEDDDMNRQFPGQRLARVALRLADGRRLTSPVMQARGDPETPLTTDELAAKFHGLADPVLGPALAAAVEAAVLGGEADGGWVDLVLGAAGEDAAGRARAASA